MDHHGEGEQSLHQLSRSFQTDPDGPEFVVRLQRTTYYDNDKVEGTLTIRCVKEVVMPPIYVALLCRLLIKETSTWKAAAHTIYRYHKTPGPEHQEYFAVPLGITEVRLSFNLPENMPASFDEKHCSLVWDVRLLQRGTKVDTTLAMASFRKASLYYPIPGHCPTAQAEKRPYKSLGQALRVEASLSKDVYSPEEPIHIIMIVHNSSKSVYLRKVKAKLVQTVKVALRKNDLFINEHELDTCKHDARTWQYAELHGGEGGTVMEKSFMMLPQIPEQPKMAHQCVYLEGTKTVALVPTLHVPYTEKGITMSVQYCVRIKCTAVGTSDFKLSIPFSLENSRDEIPKVGINEHHVEENMIVFPLLEDPPEYELHRNLSVSSYTSLRKDSEDSIFVQVPDLVSSMAENQALNRRASFNGSFRARARPLVRNAPMRGSFNTLQALKKEKGLISKSGELPMTNSSPTLDQSSFPVVGSSRQRSPLSAWGSAMELGRHRGGPPSLDPTPSENNLCVPNSRLGLGRPASPLGNGLPSFDEVTGTGARVRVGGE